MLVSDRVFLVSDPALLLSAQESGSLLSAGTMGRHLVVHSEVQLAWHSAYESGLLTACQMAAPKEHCLAC